MLYDIPCFCSLDIELLKAQVNYSHNVTDNETSEIILKWDRRKDMVILRVTYTTDPPARLSPSYAPKVQNKTIRKYNASNMAYRKLRFFVYQNHFT